MNVTDRQYALDLDKNDPLAQFKSKFVISDPAMCYLDGNSLGRLPHATVVAVNDFLTQEWGQEVVTGWSHWVDEAQPVGDLIGESTLGAAKGQVLACDTTSVNFYQLCMAAIKARPGRKTIITDTANFPTDRYILEGIAKQFGMNLVLIDNESAGPIKHERITAEILAPYLNDDVALVTLEVIHAIGAIEMNFDANGVDLAVGCTYKYGNSGPGAPAWLYVATKMQKELQVPIQGWFSQGDQFGMGPVFEKAEGIRGFQIASPSLIGLRCIKTSFELIKEAGIDKIAHKAAVGTQMMIDLYDAWLAPLGMQLNTSRDPKERGGHISLVHPDAARICVALREFANVIPDYRTPNSIRLAISPLPTSYVEVWDGFERIRDLVSTRQYEKVKEGGSRVT